MYSIIQNMTVVKIDGRIRGTEHERQFLINRVAEGKSKNDKHEGIPEGSRGRKTDKADYIKEVIQEQFKDFDGKFSDAEIMREYLQGEMRIESRIRLS